MERFRLDHPREEVANQPPRFRNWPAERVDLETLQQMLSPMGQDDYHEQPQSEFVLRPVEPFDQRRVGPFGSGMGYAHPRSIDVVRKTSQS